MKFHLKVYLIYQSNILKNFYQRVSSKNFKKIKSSLEAL